MNNKRLFSSIIEILLGIILVVLGCLQMIDSYWTGMGTAFLTVGVLQLIRQIRYNTDKEYKENVDVAVKDERNRFLSMKAWSWAGYIFVLLCAVASIALKIAGYDDLMKISSGSVCVILILYWISYWILKKKY